MSAAIQIRFSSIRFVIESATLWLLGFTSEAPGTSGGTVVELGNSFLSILEADVVDGSVKVSIPKPGPLEGMLIGIRVRRSADGKILLPVWSEFSHEVSETNWRSGIAIVNMDNYKEVLLRVQDSEGRPVSGEMIGFVRQKKEGGIDLTTDGHGEVMLLLSPGMYGASGRGVRTRFEVTTEDTPQVVSVTANRFSVSP